MTVFFDYNGDGETDFNEAMHGFETMREIDEGEYVDEYDEGYDEYEENDSRESLYEDDEYKEDENDDIIQDGYVLDQAERIRIALLLARAKCDYLKYEPTDEEIAESGFSNIREYNAAFHLLCCLKEKSLSDYQVEKKDVSLFILEHSSDIEAAKYLSIYDGFLFSEAIRNNFTLPCALPMEKEKREYNFCDILEKLSNYDETISIEVWKWCLKTFIPYSEYDESVFKQLCNDAVLYCSLYKESFIERFIEEFEKDEDFYNDVFKHLSEYDYFFALVLTKAIEKECYKTADNMFRDILNMINGYWKDINRFIDDIIMCAPLNKDLIVMEYFKNNIFPIIKEINIGMVQDEVKNWEKKIDDYILKVEMNSEKYAYSRRNAWRKEVPDGKKYGLNVLRFYNKEDYLKAYKIEEERNNKIDLGEYDEMNGYLFNFDTRSEFLLRLTNYLDDRYIKKEDLEKIINKISEKRKRRQNTYSREFGDSSETVIVYGVVFGNSDYIYSYRGKEDYDVGEKVIVPFRDKKSIGEIVAKGECKLGASPFPVNNMKFIIGRKEND